MSSRSRRVPVCGVCHRRPGLYSRWLHGTICRQCWRKYEKRKGRQYGRFLMARLLACSTAHLLARDWWCGLGVAIKAWVRGR